MKATTMLAVLAAAAVSATPTPQQLGTESMQSSVNPGNSVPVKQEDNTWNTPSYGGGVKPVPSYGGDSGATKKQPFSPGGIPVPGKPGKAVDVPEYRNSLSQTPEYGNGDTPSPWYGGDDDKDTPKYGNGVPPPQPVAPIHHEVPSCDRPNTPSYGHGVKPVPSYGNGVKPAPSYGTGSGSTKGQPQYIQPPPVNTYPKTSLSSTATNINNNNNDNESNSESKSESKSSQQQSQVVNVYNQPGVAQDAIPQGASKASITDEHINQVAGQCNAVNQQNNSTAACCVGQQKKVKQNSNDGLLSGLLDGMLEVAADGCTLNLKSGNCMQNTMACCPTTTQGDDNSGKTSGITVIDASHNCIPVALG